MSQSGCEGVVGAGGRGGAGHGLFERLGWIALNPCWGNPSLSLLSRS